MTTTEVRHRLHQEGEPSQLWPRTDDPSDWVVTDGRRADNLTVKNQRYAAFHLIEHPTDGI